MKYGINLKISHASFTSWRHKSRVQTKLYRFSSLSFGRAIIRSWTRGWNSRGCRSHETKRRDKSRISTAFRPFRRSISGNGWNEKVWWYERSILDEPRILLAFRNLSSCLATFVSQLCGVWGRGKTERWLFLLLQEAPNLICTLLRLPRLNSLRYTRQ